MNSIRAGGSGSGGGSEDGPEDPTDGHCISFTHQPPAASLLTKSDNPHLVDSR
jgi:hypothetical protein